MFYFVYYSTNSALVYHLFTDNPCVTGLLDGYVLARGNSGCLTKWDHRLRDEYLSISGPVTLVYR